jgi:hypothetical protein
LIGVVPCWLSVLLACGGAYVLAGWAGLKASETSAMIMIAMPGQALVGSRWALIVFAVVWIAASGVLSWLACRRWPPIRVVAYNIAATLLALTLVCMFVAFGLMGVFAPLDWGTLK